MSLLEKVGEATISAAARIAKAVQRIKFYSFFERRGVEPKDYAVLKTQLASLAFFVSSVLFIFGFFGPKVFLALAVISGGGSLLLISSLREYFEQDFKAYRDFFAAYLGISVALVLIKAVKPVFSAAFPNLHLVVFSIMYIAALSFLFKRKYGREYTFGRVIEDGETLKIKVNYDIRASVKPCIAAFKNTVNAKKGDVVKLDTKKSFLNLRGSKIASIIEVL